ncbi:MAG: CoA-binding protein [Bacteroidetes bacterium]|nr:MAG: CoA-binding protein [Bacteroidota bacterium]
MRESKRTLVIGATPKPERYAYMATEMLHDFGHEVIPYGIKKGAIGEFTILNEWPTDDNFDTITLYINPNIQENFYDRILALKPNRIIFNPGTENLVLTKMAQSQNIVTLEACTLVLLRTNQY